MGKFGHTVINYNTLLIVDLATQEQRYAHNVYTAVLVHCFTNTTSKIL